MKSFSSGMRAGTFCAIVLVLGLLVFALPTRDRVTAVTKMATTTAPVVLLGPSTIDFVSKCDSDKRTVAEMLGAVRGGPVLDASYGGQALSDGLNLGAFGSRARHVTDVVLPIAHPYSDDWTVPSFSATAFYTAVTGGRILAGADTVEDAWGGLIARSHRPEMPYRFEGKDYPDYRILSATEFGTEKKLETCPGVLSHDPAFTRSYYWWTHVATRYHESLPTLLIRLNGFLAASGKRLHVVILPTNQQLLGTYSPDWPRLVLARQRRLADDLRRHQVAVIDLADQFPNDEFAVQWCACIHLNEKGRLHLAEAIATGLQGPAPARSGS